MNLLMSFHGVCKCAVEFSIWQTLKITKLGWIIAVFLLEFTHFTLFPDLRSKSVISQQHGITSLFNCQPEMPTYLKMKKNYHDKLLQTYYFLSSYPPTPPKMKIVVCCIIFSNNFIFCFKQVLYSLLLSFGSFIVHSSFWFISINTARTILIAHKFHIFLVQ
jgi:hypothetical protein